MLKIQSTQIDINFNKKLIFFIVIFVAWGGFFSYEFVLFIVCLMRCSAVRM